MPSPRLLSVNHASTGAGASAYLVKDRCFEEGPLRAGLT
jgi:hypothetical protein